MKSQLLASDLYVFTMVTLGKQVRSMFIDLLVMGPAERKSLGERLLGSTVDHVLRHALQPVLCVRNRAQAPYQRMAIATDFSKSSTEALDSALVLFPDAKATVVHAYEDTLHGLLPFDQMTGRC